jgi:hypothetical protein
MRREAALQSPMQERYNQSESAIDTRPLNFVPI